VTRFRGGAVTDPGGRTHNEDAWLSRDDLGLWAVADGAGGHAHGAAASRAVVAALDTIPPGLSAAEMLAQVRLRLGAVHAALLASAAEQGDGCVMASTVVVLIARGAHFACLWAGDSRAYRLRGGLLDQLTHDHSLIQELVDEGGITETEADVHPQRNVITRAIGGGADELQLDKMTGRLLAGDRFLLCSDGLCKTLSAGELVRWLSGNVPLGNAAFGDAAGGNGAASLLVAAALEQRASDNVTAVVVEVAESPTPG